MGWDGIFDLIGTVAKWWTPEKVKARSRAKLKKLQREEHELLKKIPNYRNTHRLLVLRRNIKRLSEYLANN